MSEVVHGPNDMIYNIDKNDIAFLVNKKDQKICVSKMLLNEYYINNKNKARRLFGNKKDLQRYLNSNRPEFNLPTNTNSIWEIIYYLNQMNGEMKM